MTYSPEETVEYLCFHYGFRQINMDMLPNEAGEVDPSDLVLINDGEKGILIDRANTILGFAHVRSGKMVRVNRGTTRSCSSCEVKFEYTDLSKIGTISIIPDNDPVAIKVAIAKENGSPYTHNY